MMHAPIDMTASQWCILRTSGGKTLGLARSLSGAGIEAWSPKKTTKRPIPGKRPNASGRRPMMEVDAPILPTFVFARAVHLADLMAASSDPASQHPAFSVFRHAGRIPLVGDRSIAGLQEEEQAAIRMIEQLRECESAEQRRIARAAIMRTERERAKALRSERKDFATGEAVKVAGMPALAGMSAEIVESNGKSAIVLFNKMLKMTIEAWRLAPDSVKAPHPVMGVAA